MGMFASSAVIYGLLTTWRTTSLKRSSNHPGQVPGNQLRYSPANSESGRKHREVSYIPALGEDTVKYAAGRDLLVLVGEKTITCNDIVCRSYEVPIKSQKPAESQKSAAR